MITKADISGQPKAMAAFVSGEMRDTVEIHPAGAYGAFISAIFDCQS